MTKKEFLERFDSSFDRYITAAMEVKAATQKTLTLKYRPEASVSEMTLVLYDASLAAMSEQLRGIFLERQERPEEFDDLLTTVETMAIAAELFAERI